MSRHSRLAHAGSAALAAAAVLLSLSCGGPPPPAIPSAPHPIIVVDIDSLRADHLGCYGAEQPNSPNIDALAAESIRFDWAFSQAPDTAPSQASILTGLYPTTHGMVDETTRLADQVTTLAEALAANGYHTAAFVDGGYMSEDFGFAQGFAEWHNSHGAGISDIGPKVLSWLGDHSKENFLLLVHAYDPHAPYAPAEPYRSAALGDLAPPSDGFVADPEHLEAAREGMQADPPVPMPEADLAYAKALYDGEIRQVDAWIGELMSRLKSLGLDQRASVVLISDHGQEFGEHHDLLHDQIYTTVTRVPFLLRLPRAAKAQVIPHFVECVDLAPTLLDLAGAPAPPAIQGDSLVPMIRGESRPPYLAFGESTTDGGQRYAALAGYRLVLSKKDDRAELYDLSTDPLELHDLAADEPDRVAVLRQHLESWEEAAIAAAVDATHKSDIDQETLEQLKGLGYIQ